MNEIMTKFDIKPGDLIEWVYEGERIIKRIVTDETLWSTIENRYVSIGSKCFHLCIYNDGETYS